MTKGGKKEAKYYVLLKTTKKVNFEIYEIKWVHTPFLFPFFFYLLSLWWGECYEFVEF